MAAESEMSAFSKIRKAATKREWCPERPSAEAEQSRRNERMGPKHSTLQPERIMTARWGQLALPKMACSRCHSEVDCGEVFAYN